MVESYKKSLNAAAKELTRVFEQEEELESRLLELKERKRVLSVTVESLAELCNIDAEKEYPHLFPENIGSDVGFTDAIRSVLKAFDSSYTSPVSVRDALEKKGFDLSKYKNPLASIHTILKRLVRSGEADTITQDSTGRVLYTWIGKRRDEEDE